MTTLLILRALRCIIWLQLGRALDLDAMDKTIMRDLIQEIDKREKEINKVLV